MTRQECNLELVEIFKNSSNQLLNKIAPKFKKYVEIYPQQRAGQIICNYICDDYRDSNPSPKTIEILNTLFPNDPDPFFEESSETLKRWK